MQLVLKAQKETMQFRDDEVKSLLAAAGRRWCARWWWACRRSSAIYKEQRDAAADVASMQSDGRRREAAGEFNMKELLESGARNHAGAADAAGAARRWYGAQRGSEEEAGDNMVPYVDHNGVIWNIEPPGTDINLRNDDGSVDRRPVAELGRVS